MDMLHAVKYIESTLQVETMAGMKKLRVSTPGAKRQR
jgi:hypothetical protein